MVSDSCTIVIEDGWEIWHFDNSLRVWWQSFTMSVYSRTKKMEHIQLILLSILKFVIILCTLCLNNALLLNTYVRHLVSSMMGSLQSTSSEHICLGHTIAVNFYKFNKSNSEKPSTKNLFQRWYYLSISEKVKYWRGASGWFLESRTAFSSLRIDIPGSDSSRCSASQKLIIIFLALCWGTSSLLKIHFTR